MVRERNKKLPEALGHSEPPYARIVAHTPSSGGGDHNSGGRANGPWVFLTTIGLFILRRTIAAIACTDTVRCVGHAFELTPFCVEEQFRATDDFTRKTTSETTSGVSESSLALLHVARVAIALSKSRKSLNKKPLEVFPGVSNWVQGLDLNQRPSGYEPDELPGCSTLQQREGQTLGGMGALSTSFLREFTLRTCQRRERSVCSTALFVKP
jgi:hypothetical protein